MQRFVAALVAALSIGAFLCLLGIPIFVASRQRRRSRYRIMLQGQTAEAVVTKVLPHKRSDRCRVCFSFQPDVTGATLDGRQESSLTAVSSLGLAEGSRVRVHYLTGQAQYAFIEALVVAERILAARRAAAGRPPETSPPEVHFITYTPPVRGTPVANAFRWSGDGDITVTTDVVRFTACRARPFWIAKVIEQEFARSDIRNVEVFERGVRCEVVQGYQKPRALQFWALNAQEATAIGASLPDSKTSTFAPHLAERAAFNARLLEVSPHAPVTPALIGINVVMFLIAAALGGGIFVPNPEVMIRLGSDYTPLTAAAESWRLLTSTFLHFGILHLAFNMWALWVNGVVAERLYGSSRYLTLYLVAGVAGSITSFLWHPFVNGAGASGAIFGVVGALLAYFLRSDSGIPASVLKPQRNAAAIFIVVSLLNAARVRGVDNAAHLGGVVAGFVMGWLLSRPLDVKRDEKDWTAQWVQALAVVGGVLIVGYFVGSGQWHPRVIQDASGRPVSFAELAPPPHTFGGVTLGMSMEELQRAKGKPLQADQYQWTYNSIDSAHDGLLEVLLTRSSDHRSPRVWGVEYLGKPDAEPPGMPNLIGFTAADVMLRYGAPAHQTSPRENYAQMYFSNGMMVWLERGKVKGYGVYVDPNALSTTKSP
jgi:membrane associated rhomboid family serine protease